MGGAADAAEVAAELQGWLEGLGLEARVIGALRRELEFVRGLRADATGRGGALAGVDRARFVEELHRDDGGLLRRVPALGPSAMETLRAAIPAPPRGRRAQGARVAAPPVAETPAPPQAPAPVTPAAPDEAPPPARGRRRARRGATDVVAEGAAAPAAPAPVVDVTPVADVPAAPAADTALVADAPADAPGAAAGPPDAAAGDAPARRRGRRRRAAVADVGAALAAAVAPAVIDAPAPGGPDTSEAALLRLWRALHPQARRAALGYIGRLLVEG